MDSNERAAKIEQYGRAGQELADALSRLSPEELRFKPGPDRWSAHEIVVHIADAEANSYVRLHKTLAEPGELIMAYDQNTWARKLNYMEQDMELHLQLFTLLRKACYEIVKNLPEEAWSLEYNHPEYGLVKLDNWLDIYARHVAGHIDQIYRNMAAMKLNA